MNPTSHSQKRNDFILTIVVLAAALIGGGGYYLTHRDPALRAEITIDGELAETLDLSRDQEITIHGVHGGTNHLIVKDGAIWCEEASCPDGVCIRQGKQNRDGGMIVCLPNRMIVKVIGND